MSEKLKLRNNDVLVRAISKNAVSNSNILIVEADEQKEKINHFQVIQVAEGVTDVKAGDIVLIEYAKHTFPFTWNNEQVAVTSIDEIVAVYENE